MCRQIVSIFSTHSARPVWKRSSLLCEKKNNNNEKQQINAFGARNLFEARLVNCCSVVFFESIFVHFNTTKLCKSYLLTSSIFFQINFFGF